MHFTIRGYKGTAAEKYALQYHFKFISLDSSSPARTTAPKKSTTAAKKSTTATKITTPTAKKQVKIGSTWTVGSNRYVVSSSTTVRYKKPVSKKIKKIIIPNSVIINGKKYIVTAIGKKAFVGCSKLKTVTITANIKKIGKYAFYRCKKLKTIRIYTTKLKKKNVLKGAVSRIYKKAVFYVPKGKKTSYKKIFTKRGATKEMKFKTN